MTGLEFDPITSESKGAPLHLFARRGAEMCVSYGKNHVRFEVMREGKKSAIAEFNDVGAERIANQLLAYVAAIRAIRAERQEAAAQTAHATHTDALYRDCRLCIVRAREALLDWNLMWPDLGGGS